MLLNAQKVFIRMVFEKIAKFGKLFPQMNYSIWRCVSWVIFSHKNLVALILGRKNVIRKFADHLYMSKKIFSKLTFRKITESQRLTNSNFLAWRLSDKLSSKNFVCTGNLKLWVNIYAKFKDRYILTYSMAQSRIKTHYFNIYLTLLNFFP
jgi:hypothetical protein